jgi:hypothetical protein
MAINASHAAKQGNRTFTVEVLSAGETATVLATALRDYLDAVDCAMEWLRREGHDSPSPRLAIFATCDGLREQVWAYPPEGAEAEPKPLVETFGFDPVAWNPPAREFTPVRHRPPERESTPGAERLTLRPAPLRTAALPEVEPPTEPEQPSTRRLPVSGLRLREEIHAVWEDRPSRWCAILGPIFLWLSVTLVEPAFLLPVLAAGMNLWLRHGRRAALTPDGVDDWF